MNKVASIAEHITRLHCGQSVEYVMTNSEAGVERGMLHMVLDALNYCANQGYEGLAATYGRGHSACDRDWAVGLAHYSVNQHFRADFHAIYNTLQDERA